MVQNKLRTRKLKKYFHLVEEQRQSTLSKSKKLYLYIYFLDYDDPADIPLIEIADYSGVKIDVFKGMLRSATHNFKISLALRDIDVEEDDIPSWFCRNTRLSVKTLRPGAQVVHAKVTTTPEARQADADSDLLMVVHLHDKFPKAKKVDPWSYALGPSFVGGSSDLNKNTLEMLRGLNKLIDENQGLQKKPKYRDMTLKELLTVVHAHIEAKKIQEDLDSQKKFQEALLIWYTYEQNKSFLTSQDVTDLFEGISEALSEACKNLPKPQTLKIEDLDFTPLLSRNDYHAIDKQIKELEKSLPQQRKEDMLFLAKTLKEVHERNKQIKFLRHGNLIKPQEIHWPPGYEPIDVDPRSRSRKT